MTLFLNEISFKLFTGFSFYLRGIPNRVRKIKYFEEVLTNVVECFNNALTLGLNLF